MYKILCAFVNSLSIIKKIPLYQGNTLFLTITFVSLVNFQTACKMTSRPSVLAENQEPKNPDLYY